MGASGISEFLKLDHSYSATFVAIKSYPSVLSICTRQISPTLVSVLNQHLLVDLGTVSTGATDRLRLRINRVNDNLDGLPDQELFRSKAISCWRVISSSIRRVLTASEICSGISDAAVPLR